MFQQKRGNSESSVPPQRSRSGSLSSLSLHDINVEELDTHSLQNISACRFLSNYSAIQAFEKFAEKEYNCENIRFVMVATVYKLIDWKPARWFGLLKSTQSENQREHLRRTMANVIYKCFISNDSDTQICLKASIKRKIDEKIGFSSKTLFDEALNDTWRNIEQDQLVRFLKSSCFQQWKKVEQHYTSIIIDAISAGKGIDDKGSFILCTENGELKKINTMTSFKVKKSLEYQEKYKQKQIALGLKTNEGGSFRMASPTTPNRPALNTQQRSTSQSSSRSPSITESINSTTPNGTKKLIRIKNNFKNKTLNNVKNINTHNRTDSERVSKRSTYYSLTDEGKGNAILFYLKNIGPSMIKSGHHAINLKKKNLQIFFFFLYNFI